MISDPYGPDVRELFDDARHAGDLVGAFGRTARGSASESLNGARIELLAGARGETLEELRFRAFGCPHLIAAAEWVCRQFEGARIEELDAFDVRRCMDTLDIPIEKTGRILLIEDAIHLLFSDTERADQA